MANIKQENLLNIALQATEYERENSVNLDSGVSDDGQRWELIVRYSLEIENLSRKYENTQVIQLINNYGIIITDKRFVESITNEPNILFVEKPKNYYFSFVNYKSNACITPVQNDFYGLYGEGVLTAVLDSGIDIFGEEFLHDDGRTRIKALWDQTKEYLPNNENEYEIGRIYSEDEINRAIYENVNISADYEGHGTAVAGILAGSRLGVASKAEILVVKLGGANSSFPRTTSIMLGVDYAIKYATKVNMPLVINISLGNNYGSHRGNSVFERFLSDASLTYRCGIFVGAGNEGNAGIHKSGILSGITKEFAEFTIGQYESKLSIQVWKDFLDDFNLSLETPRGDIIGPFSKFSEVTRYRYYDDEVLVYYGLPNVFETMQEIYIDIVPYGDYIFGGRYRLIFEPVKISDGRYDIWMPGSKVINENTRFTQADVYGTYTIPSTSNGVISVGAYDSAENRYATFSGRGIPDSLIKPDLVADGVNINAVLPDGVNAVVSGTSFATPIVAGAGALLMEWGIVRGRDPFLYGERLKTILKAGAVPIGGFAFYPNATVGAGALCTFNSLRELL